MTKAFHPSPLATAFLGNRQRSSVLIAIHRHLPLTFALAKEFLYLVTVSRAYKHGAAKAESGLCSCLGSAIFTRKVVLPEPCVTS